MAVNLESADENGSVRIAVTSDAPLERLKALKAAEDQVEGWLFETVADARRQGESWSAISDAIGVSRQAAWKLYNSLVSAVLDESRTRSGLSDEDALELARTELKAVRRSRRRQ